MIELFSLGEIYPADFLKPDEQPRCEPVELKLVMENSGFVHLEKLAAKECMWGEKYWYRSSISNTMKAQLKNVVESIFSVYELKTKSLWIDIAGNDGYMLSQVPSSLIRVNIDPANDSFKNEAEKHCDLVIQDYFSAEVFKKSRHGKMKADVISIISMFYDISEPDIFLKDVYEILNDDGLVVFQLSYSPLMLEQLEFSNICHEHYAYYSFFTLKELLESNSFKVMDVELNNTNAGSFRVYAMKDKGNEKKFGSQTHRDVCQFRIKSLLHYEYIGRYNAREKWDDFFGRIQKLKKQVIDFIKKETKNGKTIYGYGASTKGATMLGYFGINTNYLRGIADRSHYKYGLITCGTNLPIVSEEEMRQEHPDYLFIMPFHFLSEFIQREREYLLRGGKFIVPLPTFRIITKDDL